ncbi:putative ATP/GTP binding protein [Frankia canadensis]|uniref:Putative ATP/GTP binding protein n=1 Tax=Frankia canadensis TaxID=1836972 RepID=A0A2I2KZP3_9ACTN|nr:putative ATP/GTP binding protein [Frankia canadensis]SOU58432.1 putative ATP/GTP binding protein [Frankia canadensis]
MPMSGYIPRIADQRLSNLLAELPAVLVTGPRAAGKTTSARRVANDILRLDDPAVAAAVMASPDAALRRAREPVLLDEWQEVPAILGAVKRAVDEDSRPGRFILTGSVEADLTARQWPGTGRVVRLVLHGLAEREMSRSLDRPGLLDLLLTSDVSRLRISGPAPGLDDYVDLALRSGFPEAALSLRGDGRLAWLDAYVDHVVTRDVLAAGEHRDPVRLRRYLEVLGLSTAGLPAENTLHSAAGISQRTADAYDRILAALYLVDLVPAWSTNRLSRLTKRPKRYLTDPALALAAARVDERSVLRDGDLLGRLLDTFVVAQLRPELALLHPRARLHHLRTRDGQEIDAVVDLGGGQVIALEIQASSAPTARDARHLRWLRDQLGSDFRAGVLFHTGPMPFDVDDRIWALPICALWAAEAD